MYYADLCVYEIEALMIGYYLLGNKIKLREYQLLFEWFVFQLKMNVRHNDGNVYVEKKSFVFDKYINFYEKILYWNSITNVMQPEYTHDNNQ